MTKSSKSAPLETDKGGQKDDNIDDLGRRPDGSEQDQPVDAGKGTQGQRETDEKSSRQQR